MPRPQRAKPCELSPDWPDAACDDAIAEVARLFALRLKEAIGGRSLRSAAVLTGVDHASISGIIAGRTWPDLATIARLERGLEANLWPARQGRKGARARTRT